MYNIAVFIFSAFSSSAAGIRSSCHATVEEEGGWGVNWQHALGKAGIESAVWVCQQSCQNKNRNRYALFCSWENTYRELLVGQLCKHAQAPLGFSQIAPVLEI